MADKYLSLSGVNYLWGKIKDEISASAGGGDALIVAFKWGGTNNNTRTCSHTFADVKAAYDAKKPVVAINRLTTSDANSCVLYISSATSSFITFEGLYQSNNSVRKLSITLSSSNTVNYYDNTTVVSKITNTNQLTNGGPQNADWWTKYATNNDVFGLLDNPLHMSNPDNGTSNDKVLYIYGNTPGPWYVSAYSSWTDQYNNLQDVTTFYDLYSYLSMGGVTGIPAKIYPVLMHEYETVADPYSPVAADYPNSFSSFDYGYMAQNYYFWLTLTSTKFVTYEVNGDLHNLITFVFTTTDIRLEDKATILRTFILQGDMNDAVDQSEIEIRDAVIQSVASPLYYYQLPAGAHE
ncbi:MAG: hypothetical protein IJT28_08115 [Bacteroidaceae bacterium]|nr:hypothetical protein [Bacteroidaceae bacterium]